jgi:hypothetical protein
MSKKPDQLKSENNEISAINWSGRSRIYFFLTLLFIISALYFLFFANYVFFYQENQSLFVYSPDYFHQFAVKPGGLLEYAGNFFTQFYFSPVYGSLILSGLFTLLAIVFLKIIRKINCDSPFLIPFMVLPSSLLILLQSDFNYLIHNNLGFILVALYFLFSIVTDNRNKRYLLIVAFPVFFYLTGAYAWIYLGMIVLYYSVTKEIVNTLLLLVIASLTLIFFKKVVSLQPLDSLLDYPLPPKEYFKNPVLLYLLFGFYIVFPSVIRGFSLIKIKKEYGNFFSVYPVLILFSLTIFIQSRLYNAADVNLFKLEKLFFSRDWDGVIKLQESVKLRNVVAQYYYNTALSEKDQLCNRLFFGRQDFGPNSIMVQWDSKVNLNKIFRGAYFFYAIGLVNEAHRWAFESMVTYGYRPENLKLLIKTNLINGHYSIAEKYIYVLKRTLHYRSLASGYEKMLYHPELVRSDPELGGKIRLQPREDFPVRLKDQQANVILLLQSNPGNKRAFEYMIAWFMLERNTAKVVEEIKKMKGMGYASLPRHIEEAALYFNSKSGKVADLGGLSFSPEGENRYTQFESAGLQITNVASSGNTKMVKTFGNTFWFYLEFK